MTARVCRTCATPYEAKTSQVQCNPCRAKDPHRHSGRQQAMFVSIDGEGIQDDDGIMHLVTLSYGREDGTSATHVVGDAGVPGALRWLIETLHGPYRDAAGRSWRQAAVAFHFNWDAAVIAKEFDPVGMFLIRKAQVPVSTPLCGRRHEPGDPECVMLHRFNPRDVETTITEGGEADLIAYDPGSQLAFATTPGRRFYAEYRPGGDRYEGWKRVDVHDTGSAFVGGLLTVIEDWQPELTDGQRAAISWGKAARQETFHGAGTAELATYSEAECVAHARVCRLLLETLRDAAHVVMKPAALFGSGSVAGATMKHHRVPRRDTSNLDHENTAKLTYFGGMIETPVVGLVTGTVDEVDINSAYPDKMRHMPCMRTGCGEWRTSAPPASAVVGHCQASWDIRGDDTSTPPFMVRTPNGNVYQPLMGYRTWVTLVEYRAAHKRFTGKMVTRRKNLWWDADCRCSRDQPFDFIPDLYAKRLELKSGKADHVKGSPGWQSLHCRELALKLVLNSMYGKLAQQKPDFGIFTNLHLASYITGATRTQVRVETWLRERQGGTAVYQHTDSVLSLAGEPTDGGKTLGAWGAEKPTTDFLIIQPGLAMCVTPGQGKTATRGARPDDFRRAVDAWLPGVDLTLPPYTWPPLYVERRVMVSRRLAIARGKPHLAGSFMDHPLTLDLSPRKRDGLAAVRHPSISTAWILPPLPIAPGLASAQDVDAYREMIYLADMLEPEEIMQ